VRDAESCIKRSNKEVLEAAKKCDKISVRPLRIRLSQLKLQWGSCSFVLAFVSTIAVSSAVKCISSETGSVRLKTGSERQSIRISVTVGRVGEII
jgi:hypothetical protein